MANLRRRSSRQRKANASQSSARKSPSAIVRLDSLVERDETPDVVPQSIDGVLATPSTSRTVHEQLSQLSALRTPQTEPRPEQSEMNPKTIHRSTAKAPDSGLKLGFSDIRDKRHDTPTKPPASQNAPTSSTFEFKFSADSHLSRDAQELMDSVREDAAKIKSQMMAERAIQQQKDKDAETMFGAGRKIAQPKGKAGRFSDVHMAQFKKMDSIENHASSFRTRPGYAAPTTQSLKRSPSKAGLDEAEHSRTTRRSVHSQPPRIPPPVTGRPNSVSPFKSIPSAEIRSSAGPAKRARQSEHQDVSDSRPTGAAPNSQRSSLYSPTKSSLARVSHASNSSAKPSMLPRSTSTTSLKSKTIPALTDRSPSKASPSKPLPPLPVEESQPVYPVLPPSPSKTLSTPVKERGFTSKLPTLSGLKSILRSTHKSVPAVDRPGTPKRLNTIGPGSSSTRKVDFTPSVKSRHAVKLAADSPSPAKIRRDTPYKPTEAFNPYDSSAYIIEDDRDQEWEDEDSDIVYPSLPATDDMAPVMNTFAANAREVNRRESMEFKSIFTDLHPSRTNESATLTSINTTLNKTNPEIHANKVLRSPSNLRTVASPSTIRQVRTSGVSDLVQPFEDKTNTLTQNLPGKKRRLESVGKNGKYGTNDDGKENQRISEMPSVPGGWKDSVLDEVEDESVNRAGKRARVSTAQDKPIADKPSLKKPNAAREAAAKSAKDRKGRGVLSLSRLNMLSRPKSRG